MININNMIVCYMWKNKSEEFSSQGKISMSLHFCLYEITDVN